MSQHSYRAQVLWSTKCFIGMEINTQDHTSGIDRDHSLLQGHGDAHMHANMQEGNAWETACVIHVWMAENASSRVL